MDREEEKIDREQEEFGKKDNFFCRRAAAKWRDLGESEK